MNFLLNKRPLTRLRVAAAVGVAVLADAVQFMLGPFGWAAADQIIDVLAMILISLLVGFHIFFLPTFVAEFIPGIAMLPTWTGCVLLVLAYRWKQQESRGPNESSTVPGPPRVPPTRSDVIDI